MTQHDTDMTSHPRVSVEEAAKILGVSVDAIRKRIERGTIRSEKVNKTRYVFLDGDMTDHDDNRTRHDTDMTPLNEELRDRIRFLEGELEDRKEEVRRLHHLLAGALERIPAIEEAPPEPREAPVSASEEQDGAQAPREPEKRSWWRKMFGMV
jgi:excisionase family DNA binding protein